jgi:Na+-driven multidrug efflux pump
MGVLGLWLGLSLGLIAAGTVLLRVWVLKSGTMNGDPTRRSP